MGESGSLRKACPCQRKEGGTGHTEFSCIPESKAGGASGVWTSMRDPGSVAVELSAAFYGAGGVCDREGEAGGEYLGER